MTIKSLFFSLCLYVALVWVVALLKHPDEGFREFGLFWTAAGLVAVLAYIVIARIWGWWRAWRAKVAARPPEAAKPQQVNSPEETELMALLAEANATLVKSPAFANQKSPLSKLPLYLLVGPEGSGKTSTFLNSGLEPQLLAGQVAGTAPVVSTRLCNIWFARDAAFVEVGGRAFTADVARWSQLIGVLAARQSRSKWRNLISDPEPGWALQGVVAFCPIKDLTDADPERLERQSRLWSERLRVISDVFRRSFPVYTLITKSDTATFFSDFFRLLPESEANQIFGSTLDVRNLNEVRAGAATPDVEAKRLTRSFQPLYRSLANLRLTHLAYESDRARRPAIYEFPREFKRVRSPLVQFLTDVFRPHPLQPGPVLRGYYFTATREVEAAVAEVSSTTRSDWSITTAPTDATGLFRNEATKLFRVGEFSVTRTAPANSFTKVRWMFVSDIFSEVVLRDRQPIEAPQKDPKLDRHRRAAVAAICAVSGLLCIAFVWSWLSNRSLIHDVVTVAGQPSNVGRENRLTQLRALDELRARVEMLIDYDRDSPPLGLRWGLYSGSSLLNEAREAYFRRFQQILLNDLNGALVGYLRNLPADPGMNEPYEPAYSTLKTHLMISSGGCKVEPPVVGEVLKQFSQAAGLPAGDDARRLIDRQVDFYTRELAFGNPCSLRLEAEARDRGQRYLQRVKGVDRIYANILAETDRVATKPRSLSDFSPEYAQVLRGNPQVRPSFTRDGWVYVEKASREANAAGMGDACVTGVAAPDSGFLKPDVELEQALKDKYFRDYIIAWRSFVGSWSVLPYASAEDAARKLEMLGNNRSPLLAVLALTGEQTSFPAKPAEPNAVDNAKPIIAKLIPALGKADKAAAKVLPKVRGQQKEVTTAQITKAFQPVHAVVPPNGEALIADKNTAYVDSLSQLRLAMQQIASSAEKPDPAVHQAATQTYEKALESARQIGRTFNTVGVEGTDRTVQHLLEEPIVLAKRFIIPDMGKAQAEKLNGEMRAFCGRLTNSLLRKYPFRILGEDAPIQELTTWFAPGSGEVWKFQAQNLGEITALEGSQWKAKDPAKKPQVTPEVLSFLNRAQTITNAFFAGGATQPHLSYVLRPQLHPDQKDSNVELQVDGVTHRWTTGVQHEFQWPAPAGTKDVGARGLLRKGSFVYPFVSRGGSWGLFRIMGDAESRPFQSKTIEWKKIRGGDGRMEPMDPGVTMVIVEFPGGVDLFHPKFFEGLQCPTKAIE